MTIQLMQFDNDSHGPLVIALWEQVFGYDAAHNAPRLVIDKKLAAKDDLFFVAVQNDELVGTIMAGYDGHRGWIYSIAVRPDRRNQGIGSELLRFTESRLEAFGCMKINLQIMDGNEEVRHFYETLGYAEERRVSMGKRLSVNIPDA